MKEFVISSDLDTIENTIIKIIDEISDKVPSKEMLCNIRLMISEIIINAHCHGNKQDCSKKIFIRFQITSKRFYVRIRDEGEGFDPTLVPDPLLCENLDKTSGRGIYIVKQITDEITFYGMGNDIELIKYLVMED